MKKNIASSKMSSSTQIALAAAAVLLIFILALITSGNRQTEKTEDNKQLVNGTSTNLVTGQQVARLSVLPANSEKSSTQSLLTMTDPVRVTDPNVIDQKQINQGLTVTYKIDKFKKLAVQPLKFNIFDANKKELTPDLLQTIDGHKLHFIVVSANLREFQHLFPEYKDKQWNIKANLPNPGTYYAYLDLATIKGKPITIKTVLTVREPSGTKLNYPGLTPNLISYVDGVTAKADMPNATTSHMTLISFSLNRGGKPITDLNPLMESFGKAIMFRQGDPSSFTKLQPMAVLDETKGIVDFSVRFPSSAGIYTVFGEFRIGGKIFTFPITFEVKE